MFAHGSAAMARAPRNRRVLVSRLPGPIGLALLALACLSGGTPSAWGAPGPTPEADEREGAAAQGLARGVFAAHDLADPTSAAGGSCLPPAWARNQS
ncbi:MAG: hypothetical protein ACREGL_12345, partial [Alphaproteobacteria bacterium]